MRIWVQKIDAGIYKTPVFNGRHYTITRSKAGWIVTDKAANPWPSPAPFKTLREADQFVRAFPVKRRNLMSKVEFYETADTPYYCSPSSESYWSM
jgi:hypothetical protein